MNELSSMAGRLGFQQDAASGSFGHGVRGSPWNAVLGFREVMKMRGRPPANAAVE
jgi:hypothetical protein